MKNSKNTLWSFVNAVGVFIYVALIAFILSNGDKVFGKMNNYLGPIAFLLLFVLSATITGSLVLGRPIWLYLSGFKKESVQVFAYTVLWMFILTLLAFAMNFFI